ncbi:unnamed protein product [Amoebophrya sp. A120]|nr:unnamed protein product [Amoebophrya sp. A120]|eukprot:GSA120T00000428001.1
MRQATAPCYVYVQTAALTHAEGAQHLRQSRGTKSSHRLIQQRTKQPLILNTMTGSSRDDDSTEAEVFLRRTDYKTAADASILIGNTDENSLFSWTREDPFRLSCGSAVELQRGQRS